MKVKKDKVKLISLGCSKNLVDSEFILAQLKASDIEIVDDENLAENVIINTCGFIEDAKQESIETILKAVRRKGEGSLKGVYVAGCLSERYKSELEKDIPEVDRYFGATDKPQTVIGILNELGVDYRRDLLGERITSTPAHYAYLKISEGCDNPCSFCAIPLMRGRHVSKPLDEIVTEARKLASKGVKEIIVIGQDTTYWGFDTGRQRRISDVLNALSDIDGVEWIRLMYAYPSRFPEDLIETIAGNEKICKYIDIPVQHVSDNVLKSMRRGITKSSLKSLLERLKNSVPGIAIRTTFIVGYPDETENDFEELAGFVKDFRFSRLGVFTYSHEDDTAASGIPDRIPLKEKLERQRHILGIQKQISLENNNALIGSQLRVILDRRENGDLIGRSYMDAPEIDQEIFVKGDSLRPGEFANVLIEDAEEFDLFGVSVS